MYIGLLLITLPHAYCGVCMIWEVSEAVAYVCIHIRTSTCIPVVLKVLQLPLHTLYSRPPLLSLPPASHGRWRGGALQGPAPPQPPRQRHRPRGVPAGAALRPGRQRASPEVQEPGVPRDGGVICGLHHDQLLQLRACHHQVLEHSLSSVVVEWCPVYHLPCMCSCVLLRPCTVCGEAVVRCVLFLSSGIALSTSSTPSIKS